MRQYSTAIGAIPPSGIFLKQCIISSIFDQTNVIGGWFHVFINLQPMIPDKGGVIWPIGGSEKGNLNRVPWDRWRGDQMTDLWWRMGSLFIK